MVAESQFMTASEFAKLPESSTPMELIDGELIVSPTPTFEHQSIIDRLTHDLVEMERRGARGRWTSSPVDLFISRSNVYQPDAMFFTKENQPDLQKLPVMQVPLIVVEVLSPSSRSRDNVRKRAAYMDRGIAEYWIVDPVRHHVVFNVTTDDEKYTAFELVGSIIPAGRYAGVELDLDWIFED